MSDIVCPYCKTDQEINHDDGYGYDEGVDYEQSCFSCNKYFKFTTSISFDYESSCQDGDHKMEHSGHKDLYDCENCDYYCLERELKG